MLLLLACRLVTLRASCTRRGAPFALSTSAHFLRCARAKTHDSSLLFLFVLIAFPRIMERKRKLALDEPTNDNNNNKDEGINPWTNKPYSQRFYQILEKRKNLPVWEQKEEFFSVMDKHQVVVFVGETGSGKTTQVSFALHQHIISHYFY